jgi:soluble epoxide hydrolase / lipid-phosphate phosphatase
MTITEHVAKSARHTSFYLAAGPSDGPLIIFVHGWPELAISWRHQLPAMAALGFRAVAPDLRGYGRSSLYAEHGDYAQEPIVADMLELMSALGRESAVWVGHDWGSAVVWSVASHHPERVAAVASLCVPYATLERGLEEVIPLVDRKTYPAEEFPVGQWDYMRFYEENFAKATATFEANPYNTVKLLFRKSNPAARGKPAATAFTRKAGGWFGGAVEAPDLPRDADVVSEQDLRAYAASLARTGFFGPDSYYMNHQANAAYAAGAANDGRLDMPVLFLAGAYDYVCETIDSRLAEPMRRLCRDLTERVVFSGHWMAQEKPAAVNAALAHWLATRVPGVWPGIDHAGRKTSL